MKKITLFASMWILLAANILQSCQVPGGPPGGAPISQDAAPARKAPAYNEEATKEMLQFLRQILTDETIDHENEKLIKQNLDKLNDLLIRGASPQIGLQLVLNLQLSCDEIKYNIKNLYGTSAASIRNDKFRIIATKLFLAKGAKIAIDTNLGGWLIIRNPEFLEYLLQNGLNPRYTFGTDAWAGCETFLTFIFKTLSINATRNARNAIAINPIAIMESFEILIKWGANVNDLNSERENAILVLAIESLQDIQNHSYCQYSDSHLAETTKIAETMQYELILFRRLLEEGAIANGINNNGQSCLDFINAKPALKKIYDEYQQQLAAHKAQVAPILEEVQIQPADVRSLILGYL